MADRKIYLVDEKNKILKITEFLVQIALAAVIGLFLTTNIGFTKQTESRSMEPDIQPNSVIFINRLAYLTSSPDRFDTVGFYRDEQYSNSDVLVRMIIGLPGETICIKKGEVYINNQLMDVSAYIGNITSDGVAETEIALGPDEYFVLGSNPQNSEDSRSSTVGNVKRSQIMGHAWMVVSSSTQIKFIN